MSRPSHLPPRVRRNTKPLEALKAGSLIIALLLVCILILWVATQLLRQKEPEPDLTPQPGKSMWDGPAPAR